MAGEPLRQTIPLADTIRSLSGDSSGLARELAKERTKLEREIEKTLKSAGTLDGKLTQKLDALKQRQIVAGAYVDRSKMLASDRSDMMAVRSTLGKGRGALELASGQINVQGMEDITDLLQMTGARLARAGLVRTGNNLARLGSAVAQGVSSVAMPAMAAFMTAEAGYNLGGKIGDQLWGNAQEMEQKAKGDARMQEMIWGNRTKLGDKQTAFMLSNAGNPWAESWLMRDTMAFGRKYYAQANRENLTRLGYWDFAARTFSKDRGEAEDAAWVKNRMKQLDEEQKTRMRLYFESAATVRDRAIASERMLVLRAYEEERWQGVDWSPY